MNKKQTQLLKCQICGQQMVRRKLVSKIFGQGSKRVLIEDIPTYFCLNCQGQYIDGKTMTQIDKVRKDPSAVSHPTVIATAKLAA
jgi:YgiT-type zinc finger domain-containing protein